MENELISNEIEQRIISDLQSTINKKECGKIELHHYINVGAGACMDFAMLYEASYDLREFIDSERRKGTKIDVGETYISVHC